MAKTKQAHSNTTSSGNIGTSDYKFSYNYSMPGSQNNEEISKLTQNISSLNENIRTLASVVGTIQSTLNQRNNQNREDEERLRRINENMEEVSKKQKESAEYQAMASEQLAEEAISKAQKASTEASDAINAGNSNERIRRANEAEAEARTRSEQARADREELRTREAQEKAERDRLDREEREKEKERAREEREKAKQEAQAAKLRQERENSYAGFKQTLSDYGRSAHDRGGQTMQNASAIALGLMTGGIINPVIAKTIGLDRLISAPIHLMGTAMKKSLDATFKHAFVGGKTSSAIDEEEGTSDRSQRRTIIDLLRGIFRNTQNNNNEEEDGHQENPIMKLLKGLLSGAGSLLGMIGGGLLTLVAPAAIAALLPSIKEYGKNALSNFLQDKGLSEGLAKGASSVLVDALQGASLGYVFSGGNWKVAALGAMINLALGSIKATSNVMENEAQMASQNPDGGILDNVDWEGRAELALRWGLTGLTFGGLPGLAIGAALGFASPTILKFGKRVIKAVQQLLDGHPLDAWNTLRGAGEDDPEAKARANNPAGGTKELTHDMGVAAGTTAVTGAAIANKVKNKHFDNRVNRALKNDIERIKEEGAAAKAEATTRAEKRVIDQETKARIHNKKVQANNLKSANRAKNLRALGKTVGKVTAVVAALDTIADSVETSVDIIKNGSQVVDERTEGLNESWNKILDGSWDWGDIGTALNPVDYSVWAFGHFGDWIGNKLSGGNELNKTPDEGGGGYGTYGGTTRFGTSSNTYKNELYSRSKLFNITPALLEDMGLKGQINSPWTRGGNSIPAINGNNKYNLTSLDKLLNEWGYEVIYTSAMGGHLPNTGHGRGNKVDLQLKKNGQPTHLTNQQLYSLKQAGYWGSGTGALGWEPVAGQVGGGHYDLNVATGKGEKLPTDNNFGEMYENNFALASGYMPSTNESMSFQLAGINNNTESMAYSSAEMSEAISGNQDTNPGGGSATIAQMPTTMPSFGSNGGGFSSSSEKQVYAYGDVAASFVLGKWLNI